GVDFFQTFSPTPKMTTLRVLLHVAAHRNYELHSLDFSIAFLQGSLHEEIWLRRPPGFTGSFPAGTQWSLWRPVYGLRQAPREGLDTLRTTLVALGFAPSSADPSLFLRTDTTLPPFYVLVYIDDLVFATADTKALALVKAELQERHTCTDLGELRSYLGLQITRDRARQTITLTQSHMVHQVLRHFGFQYSLTQPTLLSTGHSLSAPPLDESVEPSGPYPELVGCLIYLMTCTRSDLAYPLSLLARYVAPGRHRKGSVVFTVHSDASWADDQATQRSSQGYTFSLGSSFVSWRVRTLLPCASRPAAARTSRSAALRIAPCCSPHVAPCCSARRALLQLARRALLQLARRALLLCASRPTAARASYSAAPRVAPCCPAHRALLQPARRALLPCTARALLPAPPRPSCAAQPEQPSCYFCCCCCSCYCCCWECWRCRRPAPPSSPDATAAAAAAARATATAGGGAAGAGGAEGAAGSTGGAAGAGAARGGQQRSLPLPDDPTPQQLREWVIQQGSPGGGGFGFMWPQRPRDCAFKRCVPGHVEATAPGSSDSAATPSAGQFAAALGARETADALGASASIATGPASAEALHTFTLDSGASRCFFRDCTTVTPLAAPVPVSLADPTGGPVVARASTVLPCPAVPSGSLSGLHLLAFSTNLLSNAVLQDEWVDTLISGGQCVAIFRSGGCVESGVCVWSVCNVFLVSGTLSPDSPLAPPPRSPLAVAPLQHALPSPYQERYFLLVVDDYTHYTTVFPLRRKADVSSVLIPWIRATRRQLCQRFRRDLPVLCLHSDRGGEFSSDLLWTGRVGDAPVFRVWGALSLVRDAKASRLSSRTLRCAFLGFPTDAPLWQFYHPRECQVFSSQDVTFDESVCVYRLHPHASHPTHPPLVEPLDIFSDSSGPAKGDDPTADDTAATRRSRRLETPPGFPPRPSSPPLQLAAVDSGAENAGAEPGGAETEGC
ncbi:unnamed protein product, partial [Closterium sp. NIES-53]